MKIIFKLLLLFYAFVSAFSCHAQVTNTTVLGIAPSSVVRDSLYYDNLRDSAIRYFHLSNADSARLLLEEYYTFNQKDTVTHNILREVFIYTLANQKDPEVNFNNINSWTKNYPFLKNNDRVRTVKIIECIKLSRIAFDANQYTLANNYYQILLSEIKKTPNLNEIITFPNLKTLIYNLGLQKFYDHDYKAALLIFEQGTRFYPTDTGMSTMLKKTRAKANN
ncbi:hypothetical protein [Sphingobacterium suaedae]|uniref:Tetratricopeptide repeat protein n=1 Tax=Sphingobacterium suaedae TaxID=1686402 RepID=A0ABW5KCK0_9SPHI